MKTAEQAIYTAFKECLNYPIYLGLADSNQELPYLTLQPISNNTSREVGYTHCFVQLDAIDEDQAKVWELAESIIDIINYKKFKVESWIIESVKASKGPLLTFEDGACKVPINVKFSARRERS